MMMKTKISPFIFLLLNFPAIILACPFCITTTGIAVRANILNHHFLFNLFALSLPFIIFIFISGLIYYGGALKNLN